MKSRRNKAARRRRDAKINAANQINVFLTNCAASVQNARYKGPVDNKTRAAARRVANAWTKLADKMMAPVEACRIAELRKLLHIFAEGKGRPANDLDELNEWLESGGFPAADYVLADFLAAID
jgi:hypothetical protein